LHAAANIWGILTMGYLRRMVRGLTGRAPLVCIGHSHTENVAAAAAAAGIPLESINFWRFPAAMVRSGGAVDFAPEIRSRLSAPIFSLVGGAVHHDVGLFVHPRPYDFVLPESQDLPMTDNAELVPYAAVHAALRMRVEPYFEIMAAVRAATQGPMFHMESPPVYAGEAVPNEPDWIAFYGADRQVAPAWLRYKLWRVHSMIVQDYCAEAGITYVPAPPEASDAQGFLLDKFYGTLAHANQDYGALVLRQMLELSGVEPLAKRLRRAISA